jgi:hypothetical protein
MILAEVGNGDDAMNGLVLLPAKRGIPTHHFAK